MYPSSISRRWSTLEGIQSSYSMSGINRLISIVFLLTYNLLYKVKKSDVDESTADSSLQHLELNVELEMSCSTKLVPLEVKFEGMREENTSFKVPLHDLQGIRATPTRGMYATIVIC